MHDLGQQRVRSDLLGCHDQATGAVHGAAQHFVPRDFLYRNRLPGDHGFIDGTAPIDHRAIRRELFSGPNAQALSRSKLLDGYVAFLAVGFEQMRLFGGQAEEFLDRAAGLTAGAEFENLTQQDENGHHGGSVEVSLDGPAVGYEALGKKRRRHGGSYAEDECGANSQRSQSEHVGAPLADRNPSSLKEWPTAPENHGDCQDQLHPIEHTHINRMQWPTGNHVRHRENEYGKCESKPNPEPARHVGQFRIDAFRQHAGLLLQGHSALGATARVIGDDFGMHGAGVECFPCFLNRRCGRLLGFFQILTRIALELRQATRIAEIVGFPFMNPGAGRACRLHGHAAHRIDVGLRSRPLFLLIHVHRPVTPLPKKSKNLCRFRTDDAQNAQDARR